MRCVTGKKIRRDACSAVGTVRARTPHALPTMLALRRGSRRLELVAHQRGTLLLPTKWPEGRRRGRAGGRQEYRHFSSLAQPSLSASASLRIAVPRRHRSAKFVPSPYFPGWVPLLHPPRRSTIHPASSPRSLTTTSAPRTWGCC